MRRPLIDVGTILFTYSRPEQQVRTDGLLRHIRQMVDTVWRELLPRVAPAVREDGLAPGPVPETAPRTLDRTTWRGSAT